MFLSVLGLRGDWKGVTSDSFIIVMIGEFSQNFKFKQKQSCLQAINRSSWKNIKELHRFFKFDESTILVFVPLFYLS